MRYPGTPQAPGPRRTIHPQSRVLPPEGWVFHAPRPLYHSCSWCGRELVELVRTGDSTFVCPACDGVRR